MPQLGDLQVLMCDHGLVIGRPGLGIRQLRLDLQGCAVADSNAAFNASISSGRASEMLTTARMESQNPAARP